MSLLLCVYVLCVSVSVLCMCICVLCADGVDGQVGDSENCVVSREITYIRVVSKVKKHCANFMSQKREVDFVINVKHLICFKTEQPL